MPVSPDAGEAFARGLVEVYAETEREMMAAIGRRLEKGIDGPSWYQEKLSEVSALRKELEDRLAGKTAAIEKAVESGIGRAYGTGVQAASNEMTQVGLTAAFSGMNRDAIEAIVQETLGQLGSTQFAILRQTEDAYRKVVGEVGSQIVSGGLTRREASSRALEKFAARGIKGFTDSAGRRWNLDTYAEMTMRTASGRAHVEGALRRYQDLGPEGDLVIVSDSPEECPLCRPYEGKVLSQSGDSGRYEALSSAISAGLFHPNCTHSLGLYVPGLTSPMKKTENPRGYEERVEQRRLERKVREWKRREAAAIDPKARARARKRRQAWNQKLEDHIDRHDRKRLRYRESIKGSKVDAPKVSKVTAPKSVAPPRGARGEVLGADLMESGASVARIADARKDAVFSGFRSTFDDAMRSLDEALYDLDPKFRDLFAGVTERVKTFKYRGSSSAGRKNPITTLGETSISGRRDFGAPGGIRVDPNSLTMEIEFRRSAGIDAFQEWNARGLAAQARGQDALREFFDEFPRPVMKEVIDAPAEDLAQTILHELTHAIDDLDNLALREKIVRDGIQTKVRQVYNSGNGDGAFWYAASDPAEGVAELARMYVFGTVRQSTGSGLGSTASNLTGAQWRKKYPDLAAWVEREVFSHIDDFIAGG